MLKGLGIYFPKEELQEVLTSIPLDKEEGPLKALAAIRKNVVTPDDLGSILKNIGVPLPQDALQRSVQNVALMEDGKVNLEEFIGNLINPGSSPLPETDKDMNEKNGIKDGRSSAGGEGDLSELDIVLQKMGIEASPTDHLELEKLHPINATASRKYIRIDC